MVNQKKKRGFRRKMFEFIPEDPVGEIHKWLLLDDNVLFD